MWPQLLCPYSRAPLLPSFFSLWSPAQLRVCFCLNEALWIIQLIDSGLRAPAWSVCMHRCMCKYMHMKIRDWYWMSWLLLHIIIIIVIDYIFFWDKISYWTSSSSICPEWLASKPLFHSPHLWADVTGAAVFLYGFKGWYSGFYACTANTTNWAVPASPVPRFCLL